MARGSPAGTDPSVQSNRLQRARPIDVVMDDRLLADPEDPYPEGIDGPTVDVPSASVNDLSDLAIVRLFVLQVIVWNLVLMTVSVGVLLIYFRNDWTTGGQLLGAGAVLILYSLYRWPDRQADEQPARQ